MRTQSNVLSAQERERWILSYIEALDQRNEKALATLMEALGDDPELERMIDEVHLALLEEDEISPFVVDPIDQVSSGIRTNGNRKHRNGSRTSGFSGSKPPRRRSYRKWEWKEDINTFGSQALNLCLAPVRSWEDDPVAALEGYSTDVLLDCELQEAASTPARLEDGARMIRIHPRFRCEIIEQKAMMLFDETKYVVLESAAVAQLGQFLQDGPCSREDLVRQVRGTLSRDKVQDLLGQLEQDGFVVEAPPDLSPRMLELSALLNVAPMVLSEALARTPVAVASCGPKTGSFKTVLEGWGVRVSSEADITVVLTDDMLNPHLDDLNRAALQSGQPWMLVKPVGNEFFVGPLFIPGQTACWQCLAHRLRMNRRAEVFLEHYKGRPLPSGTPGGLPSLQAVALQRAASELARWIVQGRHERLEGHMLSFDARTWEQEWHPVARLPQCLACGQVHDASREKPDPLILRPRKKTITVDGGHRTLAPDAALERFKHLIDPYTGVLRHLRRLPTPPGGLLHTYQVQHSLVSTFDTLDKLRANEQVGSAGKGITDAQARMSAVGEGLERYSAVWQGCEYVTQASYNELKREAIHPHRLLGFSARQYQKRAAWNAGCPSPTLHIPEPFDEDEPVSWVPVWSLSSGHYRYVPARYGFFDYPDEGTPFCRADSNGNAAGATLEEAILQGLYELVERDAVSIWFYNRLRRPGVNLASFGEPYFTELGHYYAEVLHRDLHVLDVTSDFGIPCFVAVSRRTDRKPGDIIKGYGCHHDPALAISKALTELNQVLHNVLEDTPDGATRYRHRDPLSLGWLQTVTMAEHPYLASDPEQPLKTAADYPGQATDDVLDDLLTGVQQAQAQNIEVYVLNLTREEIGMAVVKVIAPGLGHFWRRLGFRRLYETPVKMKWREAPCREEDLNPWSIID